MNKKDWQEALKRLEAILKDASDTAVKAEKDIEELQFVITTYKNKIKEF